jgi:pimeloyl-ACP methyl ester carboxylesterase
MSHREAGPQDAPAVVLLHAFPLSAAMWQPQLDALSDRWRVVATELSFPEPSVDSAADEVARLLDELGLDRVVIGGLSMGGYVAMAFWRRHRKRVQAVVLADTRASADTDEVLERRTRQQEQVAGGDTSAVIEAMVDGLPGPYTKEHRHEVMAEIARLMSEATAEGITVALEAMKRRPDSTADLATMDVPALVVVGDEDALSPLDVAQAMSEALPRARLARIPQAGHLSSLEDPQVFNAELRAFLEGVA